MSIGFRDHEGFHRAAVAMVGVGAASGVAAHLLPGTIPAVIAGGAAGAALGVSLADRPGPAWIAARLALVTAGALAVWLVPGWTGLAVLAAAVAAALHVRTGARGMVVGTVVGGAIVMAAAFAALQIAGARETSSLPGWLVAAMGSTAMSFVAAAALLPRHLVIERDLVAAAVRSLPPGLDAEIRDLTLRGRAVWDEVRHRLDDDATSRELVRDGVLRLVAVARRSREGWVDVDAAAARIAERTAELDARIAAASDEVIAGQYREARAALDDQRRYLDGIRTGRERTVARMHNYLAALERFRLAVINLEAASASRLAAEARPLLTEVADLGAALDDCGAAVAELEPPAQATVAAPAS